MGRRLLLSCGLVFFTVWDISARISFSRLCKTFQGSAHLARALCFTMHIQQSVYTSIDLSIYFEDQMKTEPSDCQLRVCLTVPDAAAALTWYANIFDGTEVMRMTYPGTEKIMHAEMKIGSSLLMICDEIAEFVPRSAKTLGNSPVTFMLYTDNCDRLFERATAGGAEVIMAPADMFWGDRYCQVIDPFGNRWSLLTHKEDLSFEEMEARKEKFFNLNLEKSSTH